MSPISRHVRPTGRTLTLLFLFSRLLVGQDKFLFGVQPAIPFESYLQTVETVIGRRVRIRAVKEMGSERLLDGLTGRVVEWHPIAHKWVKVELDPNPITPHRIWSVPLERLVFSKNVL